MVAASPPPNLLSRLRERWEAMPWREPWEAALGALRSSLPPGTRERWWPRPRVVWLRPDGDRWWLDTGRGEPVPLVPAMDFDGLAHRLRGDRGRGIELWLEVPASHTLRRTLWLPASARPQLGRILLHEIDRQTPFAADDVVFHGRAGTPRPDGQMPVALTVLPRRILNAWLEALGGLSVQLAGVGRREDGSSANFLPQAVRAPRDPRPWRIGWSIFGLALLLLWAAGHQTLANRERALRQLSHDRDVAFESAREARRLRNELVERVDAAGFLAERRLAHPPVVALLADATDRLPESVYLERFTIEGNRIVLGGIARSASSALTALQASPYLGTPALVGAVQKDPASGRDRFTITADRRGRGG